MKLYLFYLFIFSFFFCQAQNPLVKQWDYRYGGDSLDAVSAMQQTMDGGYIMGGSTVSDSSDEVSYKGNGGNDFWVVKTDSIGNKLWDKRFGGNGLDGIICIQQTKDGGYILCGVTYSDAGGDVTQPSFDYGGSFGDVWIVKTDNVGNKIWDKRFGGDKRDRPSSIRQTKDGGYIVGGSIEWGGYDDFWLIKTDSLGTQLWERKYDGDGHANDVLSSVRETADGGFIMAGTTYIGSNRDHDYWLIKTDQQGDIQWDRKLGGNSVDGCYSMEITSDGGYILCGITYSSLSGDLSQAPHGGPDYWLVRINQLGTKQWERRFGPCDGGSIKVIQTMDQGYLISGLSSGDILYDKSESSLSRPHTWLVKTDNSGNKLWDKTILTNSNEYSSSLIQAKDSSYVIAMTSTADSGYYKSQNNRGSMDMWLIKFAGDTPILNSISGLKGEYEISISPNPFKNDISITLQSKKLNQVTFTITNSLGQAVYKRQETSLSSTYTKTLDLSYLPNGIYFLEVIVDGERTVKQLIKQ